MPLRVPEAATTVEAPTTTVSVFSGLALITTSRHGVLADTNATAVPAVVTALWPSAMFG